ncbi:MAG TPA: hypothetical protein VE870_11310, partial [Bacteroidales bacterium]|nr:hypothetical protein [Bacteroidales bacterium]
MKRNPRRIWSSCIILITLLVSPLIDTIGQAPAFPGADGFGKNTTGGRGGEVIEVTNLNDKGPGSLREAIDASGARTVVFRVSGTIFLQSALRIKNGDITIAGQTAPGDGITLANYNFNVDAGNVIVRYIRSRLGDSYQQEDDAFTCRNQENVIIDHCSFSWSVDETASCYQNKNFTMQWCIVSESLYNSIHSKGPHGYGGIWGGSRASFHHNLLAHHTSRNPRFNGARYEDSPWEEIVDYRNNVVYNWGFNSAYGGEPSEIDGIKASINMVNNYNKYGPATHTGELQYRIVSPDPMGEYGYSFWYINGNVCPDYPEVYQDNWQYGVQGVTTAEKEAMRSDSPFEYLISETEAAEDAYLSVLQNAGVRIPRLDTVDRRIIDEVTNGYATYGGSYGEHTGIIDSPADVGGWPELFSAPAPEDNDHDGMADEWEISMGLNPDDPEDRNGDLNNDGYTNLEEYINSIPAGDYFIHAPSQVSADLLAVNEIHISWQDNSGDETAFIIERDGGSGFEALGPPLPANTTEYTDTNFERGLTYTYRIMAFNERANSIYATSSPVPTPGVADPPFKSWNPLPTKGTEEIPATVTLSWSAGIGATSHKVYLGTTDPPAFVTETTDTFFLAENLEYGRHYNWRIDEVNNNGETTGDNWYFITQVNLSDILVGYWKFEMISSAIDSSIFENNGT